MFLDEEEQKMNEEVLGEAALAETLGKLSEKVKKLSASMAEFVEGKLAADVASVQKLSAAMKNNLASVKDDGAKVRAYDQVKFKEAVGMLLEGGTAKNGGMLKVVHTTDFVRDYLAGNKPAGELSTYAESRSGDMNAAVGKVKSDGVRDMSKPQAAGAVLALLDYSITASAAVQKVIVHNAAIAKTLEAETDRARGMAGAGGAKKAAELHGVLETALKVVTAENKCMTTAMNFIERLLGLGRLLTNIKEDKKPTEKKPAPAAAPVAKPEGGAK